MKLEFINSVRFVPNELVKMTDKSIIMTYIGIDRFILLSKNKDLNYAVFTIRDICDNANLSCKNRQQNCYVQKIKNHLKYFQDKGQIENIGNNSHKEFSNMGVGEEIILAIKPNFFPKENFTQITDEEFNVLVKQKYTIAKEILVATYLYVKSFMYLPKHYEEGKFSAFFQDLYATSHELGISRYKIDRCMQYYIDSNLLVKRQTGSYKYAGTVLNAPNIYVLNNPDAKMNINSALNVLKYNLLKPEYGNGEDFMPPVFNGNKINKENDEDEN